MYLFLDYPEIHYWNPLRTIIIKIRVQTSFKYVDDISQIVPSVLSTLFFFIFLSLLDKDKNYSAQHLLITNL